MIRTAASNVTAWVGKATVFYAVVLEVLAALVVGAAVASGIKPAEAAFPGKNGQIAFSSDRDGNAEIYRMNSDGTSPARLTNNPAPDAFPAYSPNGKQIAFQSHRDGSTSEIYRMSASGGSQTRLTFNSASDQEPNWQPLP